MKRAVFLILTIFVFTQSLYSQDEGLHSFLPRLEYQAYGGAVLVHRDAMDSLAQGPFFGQEFRLGFQTTGTKGWHKLYNYPIFGLGFYSANFNNHIIGKPKAAFLFMELPFIRSNKHILSTNWSVGATFNINEYDSIVNPDNIAIGTDVNVYIDFNLAYKYRISERFELSAGLKMQHFSNGAYAYPNLGLNMASAFAAIAYYPFQTLKTFKSDADFLSTKEFEYTVMGAGAWRAKDIDHNDTRYFNSTLSLSANKRVSKKRTVGIGFDHFYQGYLVDYYDDPESVTRNDLMSYAGFLSSDMIVDRFRLVVQLGFYMYKPVDFGLFFYERAALRYYATKRMFANVSIKAHGAKAEFVEWGVGVTF